MRGAVGRSPASRTAALLVGLLATVGFVLPVVYQAPPPNQTPSHVAAVPGPAEYGFGYPGEITAAAAAPGGQTIAYGLGILGGQVWTADFPSGRHASLLFKVFGHIESLEWSHDGRKLLAVAAGADESTLYVSSATGTVTEVAAMQMIEDAHWSPNTDLVVFSGLTSAGWNIFLASPAAAAVTPLTEDGRDSYSSWAHDGRSVLFSRIQGNSSNIWEVSTKGNATQITESAAKNVRPVEGPDGTIAFLSNILGEWSVFATSRSGGFQNLVLYNLTRAVVNVSADTRLLWSPDGTRLLVETPSASGAASSYVVYMNATVVLTPSAFPPSKRYLYAPGLVRQSILVLDLSVVAGDRIDALGWFGSQGLCAINSSRSGVSLITIGPAAQGNLSVYGR